MFMTTVIKYLN